MTDLKAALSHKIGPLPAGAWVAAIGGGLGISWYLRRHAGSAAASAGADTTTPDVVTASEADTPGTGGAAVSLPGNISAPIDTGGPATVETEPVTTNAMWRQEAVKWMVGNGTGAIAAEMAVANFLAGGTLSQAQADEINKAIAAIGPTPDAVPKISVAGPAAPPATPTPASPAPYTNAVWRSRIIGYLVHNEHHSTVWATGITDTYMRGHYDTLKAAGHKALSQAFAHVGPPPSPIAQRRDKGKNTNPGR